jgi:hypothetical protein
MITRRVRKCCSRVRILPDTTACHGHLSAARTAPVVQLEALVEHRRLMKTRSRIYPGLMDFPFPSVSRQQHHLPEPLSSQDPEARCCLNPLPHLLCAAAPSLFIYLFV